MKLFRTHITKTSGILTLLLGFILHLAHPVQEAKPHNAFTSWLDSHLKSDEEDTIRKQIRELGSNQEQLEQVIRQASEVVAKNSEDFELPFNSSDQEDVFKLLITEWNAYQHASAGMGKAVFLESNKSHAISQDGKVLVKDSVIASSRSYALSPNSVLQENFFTPRTSFNPFESGIAINAP